MLHRAGLAPMYGAMDDVPPPPAPAPAPPNRRLVLMTRLVLYPLAIGLIVIWWHGHRATADSQDADQGVAVTGRTSQGVPMTGRIRDGQPLTFDLVIHYTCPADRPELAHVTLPDKHTVGAADRIRGDRVTTWIGGGRVSYANGWTGVYDVRTDGRFGRSSWRGTLRSSMALRYRDRPVAVCHSGPISFDLR
jgi:hypothetical protein